MRPNDRRDRILELLRHHQRVTVEEMADRLAASRETIRRDLSELAAMGAIRKFHGGAALPEAAPAPEILENSFLARMHENVTAKRMVASAAAALFGAGDTLFVDTGTTTVMFAEKLAEVAGLTVITNSVTIANLIGRGSEDSRVFLLGGEYNAEASENLGALVTTQIGQFHAAHAVLTVGAIDVGGVLDFSMEETEVARAMIGQARRVTVIADSSKLGRTGLFQVCALSQISRLVIDRPPEGAMAAALHGAGVEIVIPPERLP